MIIVDADGTDWMAKWKRLFRIFSIDYLRSPMFFHVDPADRDGLLGYTHEQQRQREIQALPGCAGKEMSKHKKKKKTTMNKKSKGRFLGRTPDVDERDRKDYFVPSTGLFEAHCAEVVNRYALGKELLRQEKVVDIAYDDVNAFFGYAKEEEKHEHDSVISDDGPAINTTMAIDGQKIFRLETDKGVVHYAYVVVLAVGPGNAPSIPPIPGLTSLTAAAHHHRHRCQHEGFTHAMQLKQYPTPHVLAKIEAGNPTATLIVGGGLTSIQLADLAIKRGVSRVWLLMRGPVKVKYFDVELDWVGKFRNYKQAEFWSADTDQGTSHMKFYFFPFLSFQCRSRSHHSGNQCAVSG